MVYEAIVGSTLHERAVFNNLFRRRHRCATFWLSRASTSSIVYYLIYRVLLTIKGTRAAQMVIGIVLIGGGVLSWPNASR